MRRILHVYVVENDSSVPFQARENMACSSVNIKSSTPGMLAKSIKEVAREHGEEIGISFQCPFDTLISGTGKVSSKKPRPLSDKEKEEFNLELNAAY